MEKDGEKELKCENYEKERERERERKRERERLQEIQNCRPKKWAANWNQ